MFLRTVAGRRKAWRRGIMATGGGSVSVQLQPAAANSAMWTKYRESGVAGAFQFGPFPRAACLLKYEISYLRVKKCARQMLKAAFAYAARAGRETAPSKALAGNRRAWRRLIFVVLEVQGALLRSVWHLRAPHLRYRPLQLWVGYAGLPRFPLRASPPWCST